MQENKDQIQQNVELNSFYAYDQHVLQPCTQINKNDILSDQKSFYSDQFEGGGDDDAFQKVPESTKKEKKIDLQNLKEYFKIPEIQLEKIDESIFHIFEPQNLLQKIKCIVNNTFEIQMLILIFIFSLISPSLISVFFIILSHNLMFVIALKTNDRIFYGKILNIINMVILLINICWKLTLVPFQRKFQYIDILQFVYYQKYYTSLGFKVADINLEDYSFNIDVKSSFFLEIIITIAYLFIHRNYDKLQENINASKQKHNLELITFVKMYEAKHKIELQKDKKKTISIGTQNNLNDREDSNERQFHTDEVKILQKKVKRIFMNCSYFGRFNSAFFIFIIILQIFQSMNFNGLFDIPQILMILTLVSIYSFRKSFKMQFGQVTVFIAYFSSFTCLLKIIQILLIQIEFVNIYIAQNSSYFVFHAIQMIFGQQFSKQNLSFQKSTIFNVAIILLFYFCHAWRGSKWASIVEKTTTILEDKTDWDSKGSYSRLLYYIENKDNKDEPKCVSIFKKEKEYIESFYVGQIVSKKDSYDEMTILQIFKKDLNQYLPILVIWLLRIMLTFQGYMYHSYNGMLHLSWVLLSFILPLKWTLFSSCIIMIPLYTVEFFTIYVSRIPGIDITQIYNQEIYNFFINEKSDFVTKMRYPELEQFMMFMIMCLFYIGISCLKLSFDKNQDKFLIKLFQSKIETQHQKNLKWKFYFFILKYAHFIPLLILFIYGLKDLNNFRNSSFMILFTVFISSEYLYRKTSIFLNLIASFFILGQYYFSLNYKSYIGDKLLMEKLEWLNMYDKDKLNQWNDSDDVYFRFKPYPLDFLVMILASILNMINILFQDTTKADENSKNCYEIIRNKFSKEIFWLKNIFEVLQRIFRFFIIFIVIISIRYMQTNLMNWIFFSLFVINFAFIARQDNKKSTYNKCIISAKLLNYYSAFILVMEILFLAFFGLQKQAYLSIFQEASTLSYDYWLFKNFPLIYENLDLIGFRFYVDVNTSRDKVEQNQNDWFRTTFISYIVYQLISVYLISHYQKQIKKNEIDLDIEQMYLKKLFEYDTNANLNDIDTLQDQKYSQNQEKLSSNQNFEKDDEYIKFDDINGKKQQNNAILEGIFPKKENYSMYDFLDLYENLRFRDDFTVYKLMEWWWIFDIISFYGHFFTNLIILIISIYFKISFYMLFNIICICVFYSVLTSKMLKKSRELNYKSGLQDQTDVFHAYQITKEFKIYQYHQLYTLRNYIWRIQFVVLVIVMCLSFPTSNLVKYIVKQRSQEYLNYKASLDKYDTLTFWLFISGIFKDNRQENQYNYYFSYFMIGFALVLERTAINWMFDRFGCTYNKIQKFIEIDLRKQAIQNPEIWQVKTPKYNIQRYKNHYFYDDFKYLQRRFQESSAESYKLRKEGKQNEFIPPKVALRIRDFITFSVKIEGRCQDLEFNKYTEDKLDNFNELNIDDFEQEYEDFDVFKKYKINQLNKKLKESVNRKYKISFFKGVQLVVESVIVLLLLISIFIKSNIFSIIYGMLVSRIIFCSQKLKIMNHVQRYVSICFIFQYIVYILNLTNLSSPEKFPVQFFNYPFNKDLKTQYGIPLFFKFEIFKDIQISYFFGFAISEKQIHSLILDLLILYFIYIDLFNFGNPVLEKQMKKTFWSYPDKDHFQRLSDVMKEQVKWFRMEQYINEQKFQNISETLSEKEKKAAQIQYEYTKDLKLKFKNQNDLKQVLNNYLDLKYTHSTQIDENFERKIKWQLKEQSIYFRLVKQGSVLAYLSFHIFTIFVVFLSSIIRQSFLSLGYAFILLPYMKTGSEVLNQRVLNQLNKNQMMDRKIYLEGKIAEEKDDFAKEILKKEVLQLKQELESQMNEKLMKSHEQIKEEIDINNQKEWKLIKVINVYLLIFSIVDISIQTFYQLPLFEESQLLRMIGIHKVWKHVGGDGMHVNFKNYWDFGSQGKDKKYIGYSSDFNCFLQQSFLCLIVSVIYLQKEIFQSVGFKKFISQTDGSMDLLVKISVFKAKSMAYIFNNKKIIKIISIQRNKELIIQSVEKVKQQIIKWRKFTTRTLNYEFATQQTQTDLHLDAKNSLDLISKNDIKEDNIIGENKQIDKNQLSDEIKQIDKGHQSDDEISQSSQKFSSQKKRKYNTFFESQNLQAMKKEFTKKLAKELFLEKKAKLNCLSKFYLFLQNNFVNKIMFKNKKEQIQKILQKHIMQGEVEVYCELEQIMLDDAKQLIEQHLEDEEQFQDFIIQNKRFSGKKLLEISNFDKIIKLIHMENTWEFTRSFSMGFKIIETLYYIVISNTHNLIYIFMILSMFNNAGLISLVYPLSVFGYALLEENRPRKQFWDFVRKYTTFILCLKFIWNLEIFNNYAHTESFNNFEGITKLGLIDYQNIYKLTLYMLPEVMIISLVMLNEIALKLNGLYYEIEYDVENINEGIQRFIEKEDNDKFADQANSKFQLQKIFMRQQQNQNQDQQQEIYDAQDQLNALKNISYQIHKATKEFDVKIKSQTVNHHAQFLISNNIIKKSLENDNLIFVEGHGQNSLKNDFIQTDVEDDRCFSAADFENDFEEKNVKINNKDQPKPGFFEKIKYFDRLFPNLKIQKPGYDLYASTTFFLSILAIFVFLFFNKLTVSETEFLKGAQETNNIFKGQMSLCLIFIIIVIILERYINRSDTKAEQKSILSDKNQKSFFNKEQFFENQLNQRSLSVRIKTMRTQDFDLNNDENYEYLKQTYGVKVGDDGQVEQTDMNNSRTKITNQQKTKYVLHWFLIILVHIFIFWIVPITGNYQLYASPYCNNDEEKYRYGCKNFHNNFYLVIFYIIWLIYFVLSALQIRYGLPIMKKPSSILQYNDNQLAFGAANMFYSLPFAVEVRCLLDFTFSKTSLDIFQFWQTFVYHVELYVSKNGNVSYTRRILGTRTPIMDKCIFGWIMTLVIMGVLVGPFYLFSDYGGFIQPNPVLKADISVAFIVNKTIIPNTLSRKNESSLNIYQINQQNNQTTNKTQDTRNQLRASVPYEIYSVSRPFLRNFDDKQFQSSAFSNWTETRFFESTQVQECVSNEFSDTNWNMNSQLKKQFQQEIQYATTQELNFSLSLMIKYEFTRENPTDKKVSSGKEFKILNYSMLEDCLTGQQLKQLANMNCSDPLNSQKNVKMRFQQVYSRELILGATDKTYPLYRKGILDKHQTYDIFVEYKCPGSWIVYTSRYPNHLNISDKFRQVNNKTCEPIANLTSNEQQEYQNIKQNIQNDKDVLKSRLRLFLFSMLVSSSFFASYNVSTFYTTVVLVMGQQIRPLLIWGTWRAFIYECTMPDPIIKVIEYIYMKRHEEDFYGEEEAYRILQEIVRSPELFKALTGSSLLGSCDPELDKLDPSQLKKYNHLDQLERQGFEVGQLKKQIFNKNN